MATTFVGIAPVDSIPRFTFGTVSLMDGFTLLPMVIGMFAVTTIMGRAAKPIGTGIEDKLPYKRGRGFGFSFKEFWARPKTGSCLRSSACSSVSCPAWAVPWPTSCLCHSEEGLKISGEIRHRHHGRRSASETSNNASIGGAMIHCWLWHSRDGPTAMLLGAFMIQA